MRFGRSLDSCRRPDRLARGAQLGVVLVLTLTSPLPGFAGQSAHGQRPAVTESQRQGPSVFLGQLPGLRHVFAMLRVDVGAFLGDDVRAERMRGSDNERAVARWAEFEYLVDVVVGKRGERRHLAYSEALAAFTADAPGPAPADAKALARDRTVLSMAMSGYGPKVIADVVAGRLTIEVVEQSAKLRLVGHTDAEIARYLAAHVAARTAVPAPPAIRIDQAARERFDHAVVRHAQRQGVDPDLVRAVIKHESAWNAAARSHKGAIGLMQLMPETARLLGVDPVDPEQNIAGGVRYLADLRALFNGNLEAAIVGYIAGPTYAQKWLRGETVLDGEVRAYLNNVKASYARRSGWRKD